MKAEGGKENFEMLEMSLDTTGVLSKPYLF